MAGYKVVYDGLTYATVRGAGHEVSKSQPDRLYALFNSFVGNLWYRFFSSRRAYDIAFKMCIDIFVINIENLRE